MNKQCAIIALTWDRDGDPLDTSKWDVASFNTGTRVTGAAVIHLLQRFDIVILPNWPTPEMIRIMRETCPNTRFLAYLSLDAVNDTVWAGRAQEDVRKFLYDFRLLGTDGKPVNIYEGKGRTALSISQHKLVQDYRSVPIESLLQSIRNSYGYHGWFMDSVSKLAYYGSATNAPEREDRSGTWLGLFWRIRNADHFATLWANTTLEPTDNFAHADAVFWERPIPGAKNGLDRWDCKVWTGKTI